MNSKVLAADNPAASAAPADRAKAGPQKPLPEDALILIPMRNTVLFPGVIVHPDAEVVDSVIMQEVVVGAGARVDRAIVDKYTRIGAGAVVGEGEMLDRSDLVKLEGLTLLGKDVEVPAGAAVSGVSTGVTMPSRYSSEGTKSDAGLLAQNLGIRFLTIPIEGPFEASLAALAEPMAGTDPGIAEENLQARIRGNYLMTLSNKFGWLVLTTGNKSEMAVGYSTLYGDMAGGFAVIKDVPKTLVYALSEYRNTLGTAIPETTITRPPSAELRPDQKDTDSLPPYDILDGILHLYVEEDRSLEEIVQAGYDEPTVRRVILMVDRNEYKRRQAPPGLKITPKAFGRDRRLPITNRYHDW
jgi:NAD+ synthase (glutamine-hydrolysing)